MTVGGSAPRPDRSGRGPSAYCHCERLPHPVIASIPPPVIASEARQSRRPQLTAVRPPPRRPFAQATGLPRPTASSMRAQLGQSRRPQPTGASLPHPVGPSPRHRDCRVAIAPRNDSCYGTRAAHPPCHREPLPPPCHCERSAAISTTTTQLPFAAAAWVAVQPRHQDCRVANAPRNDRLKGSEPPP